MCTRILAPFSRHCKNILLLDYSLFPVLGYAGMKLIVPRFLLLLGAAALLASCSQVQQQQESTEPEQKTEEPSPMYLGTVHQVFPSDKFALLRIIGPMPAEGTVLITHPVDGVSRMANLIVSSAQHARNNFIAADIRAGVVAKGDRVFQYRAIAAPFEAEEEQPEPATLGGEEIDLGYIPPAVQALREKARAVRQQDEEQAATPTVEPASVVPEEEEDESPAPQLPATNGLPKFDDIPDTLGGWDAM